MAKITHSKYVILTNFPLPHKSRERASGVPYGALPVFSNLRTFLYAVHLMTLSESLKTSDWMNMEKMSTKEVLPNLKYYTVIFL
jgi:hypothetical protein